MPNNKFIIKLILFIALLLIATSLYASPNADFEKGGIYANSINFADWNEDGELNIILDNKNEILILKNKPPFDNLAKITLKANIISIPAIGDLNNDGNMDLVVTAADGKLYAYTTLYDKQNRKFIPQLLWSFKVESCASPVIADLDGDSALEILIGSNKTNMFYVLEGATGFVKWLYKTEAKIIISPAVADIMPNSSGIEIIIGDWNGNLYCLSQDGDVLWKYLCTGKIDQSPIITQTKGFSYNIIIAHYNKQSSKILCLNPQDQSILWENNELGRILTPLALVEQDQLVFNTREGHICILDTETGKLLWDYISTWAVHSPICADWNGQEGYEFFSANMDGEVFIFSDLAKDTLATLKTGIITTMAVIDLDHNKKVDLLIVNEKGKMYYYKSSRLGQSVWSKSYGNSANINNYKEAIRFASNPEKDSNYQKWYNRGIHLYYSPGFPIIRHFSALNALNKAKNYDTRRNELSIIQEN